MELEALVSYALAKYFLEVDSNWYVQNPPPRELVEAIAISFDPELNDPLNQELSNEYQHDYELIEATTVKPDVDIVLRNSNFMQQPCLKLQEPILLLSVKTSLVDRAGQAARWKIYFDLATNPCPFIQDSDCVYRQLGIRMHNARKYHITHGIVTANIYKFRFSDKKYHKGELLSGQTRSNTYMFDLKLTTRDDGIAETPENWNQLPYLINVLEAISESWNLPL